jgi:hypothetical protein
MGASTVSDRSPVQIMYWPPLIDSVDPVTKSASTTRLMLGSSCLDLGTISAGSLPL